MLHWSVFVNGQPALSKALFVQVPSSAQVFENLLTNEELIVRLIARRVLSVLSQLPKTFGQSQKSPKEQ